MATQVEFTLQDANGQIARMSMYCLDAGSAQDVVPLVKALTNAKILKATYQTELDLTGLAANAAVAANNESVFTKARVSFDATADGTGIQNARTEINIPAPVGDLINGLNGNPADARVTPFVGKLTTNRGEITTDVRRIDYARAR